MQRVSKIISGGQTGADRGGLDAAISLGLPHGGYCPKDRVAEDGVIPEKYWLIETANPGYRMRTQMNIINSSGTVVFTRKRYGPGSRLTLRFAEQNCVPVIHLTCWREEKHICTWTDFTRHTLEFQEWLDKYKIHTLNVAGSRESSAPGIQAAVRDFLCFIHHCEYSNLNS